MDLLRNRGERPSPLTIKLIALAAAQIAVGALAILVSIWPDSWLRGVALVLALGSLGMGAAVFVEVRRLTQVQRRLRAEIDALAGQQLAELLVDAVKNRDAGQLRKRLPEVSDPGLALLTGRVEDACVNAVHMAVEHEDIRSGYTEVFVNMFRRTQGLLQRQLQVIERLEQGHRPPADMHLLFQLDHLVTRMRRNNENVLVLAGTELVRATKNPVSIADVFRAAMSEVDKYQRIRVLGTPQVRISNTAAGDLIRIIAELLDNATSFSPPDKEVTINAELARHQGLSIGVFDNGVGMSDEDIHRVNKQLQKLGSAEIARSRRAGLFVVGRLAGRNAFKVELFGGDDVAGVSALISVPSSALLDEDAVRATLRRDSHAADRVPALGLRSAGSSGSAVAVMTSVRRPDVKPVTQVARAGSRQMSSWYSASKTWRAERDGVLNDLAQSERDDAEVIGRAHAEVPEELPLRVPAKCDGEPSRETAAGVLGARIANWWFRARGRSNDSAGTKPEWSPKSPMKSVGAEPDDWASKSDQVWRTVVSVSQSAEYTYTEDGLPLRPPGAHLLPGSAGGGITQASSAASRQIERDPAHMRRRLSSYQLGVQKAKEQEDRMRGRRQTPGGWTVLERKAEK